MSSARWWKKWQPRCACVACGLYGTMGGVLTAAAAHYSATTSGGAAVQRVPNNACNAAQGTPLRVRARTAFSPRPAPSRTPGAVLRGGIQSVATLEDQLQEERRRTSSDSHQHAATAHEAATHVAELRHANKVFHSGSHVDRCRWCHRITCTRALTVVCRCPGADSGAGRRSQGGTGRAGAAAACRGGKAGGGEAAGGAHSQPGAGQQ